MKTLKLVKSIRKDLGFLFIGALITICIIDFWLIDMPEYFKSGFEIGQIIYKLSMSYVSAFIFYFLVIHIKQERDKENLYSYIANKVYVVIGTASNLILEISKASNITLAAGYPSDAELDQICKSINPNANAPLLIGGLGNYANWIQYFDYYKKRSNDATGKIFKKMPFLETELVNILAKIEDCSYFGVLGFVIHRTPMGNQDITAFQSNISDYFELIKELERYANKKLLEYK